VKEIPTWPSTEMQSHCDQVDAGELTPDRLLKLVGQPQGTAVEETSLDDLFATVPSEDKAKFQKLLQVIQEHLSGVKVFKVGDEAERDVYIVGKAKDGRLAGLKTTVVAMAGSISPCVFMGDLCGRSFGKTPAASPETGR
jgi:hypothetical protein